MDHQSILDRLLEKVSTTNEDYGIIVKKKIIRGKANAKLQIVCNENGDIQTIYTTSVEDKSMEKAVHDVYMKALSYVFKVGLFSIREIKFK